MTEPPLSDAADAAGAPGDALTRELTALLDAQPSPEFSARVRTRVRADRELRRAWWRRPAIAAVCAATVILGVAIGFDRREARVVEQDRAARSADAARVPPPATAAEAVSKVNTVAAARATGTTEAVTPIRPEGNVSVGAAPPRGPVRAMPGAARVGATDAWAAAMAPDAAGFRLFLRRLSDGTLSGSDRLPAAVTADDSAADLAAQAAPLSVPPLDIAPLAMASAVGDTE